MDNRMTETENNEQNDISSLLNTIDSLVNYSFQGMNKTAETREKKEEPYLPAITAEQFDKEDLRKKGFAEAQIEEMEKGISQQLPIELYGKKSYNWMQMQEIRRGLAEELDTALYENPMYSASQMHEIRLGLLDHLDVTSYAKLIFSATDMRRIRENIFAETYQRNPQSFGWTTINPETGIRLRLSKDCMKAYITIPEQCSCEITENIILSLLEEYEIVYGIISSNIKKLVKEKPAGEEICIAKGKHPKVGEDGWYELFFDNCIEKGHTILPEGDIDYTDVNVIDSVVPGQILAKYHPSQDNIEGKTVTGLPVNGIMGVELPVLTGNGITYQPEQNLYYASQNGYVSYDAATSSLSVWNIYEIHGDISYLQNTEYDGAVHVFGSVKNNAVIKAKGDIIIEGYVENSNIISQQNIVIKGGVNGSGHGKIEAGGSIRGRFFEYAILNAGGLIEGNYFLQCDIHTNDCLIAKGKKARIMGGNIFAAIGIEAVIIGNFMGSRTLCNVGDINHLEKQIIELGQKKNGVSNELRQLNDGKKKLLALLGMNNVSQNNLYQKTCLAIEIKEKQLAECNHEIARIKIVINRASRAYVRAQREVQANVTFIINGKRRRIEQDITQGLSLPKSQPRKKK